MSESNSTTGPEVLGAYEGVLPSWMGKCYPGDRTVMRGVDLHDTFKDADWFDLFVFSITGRRLAKAELSVLQTCWTCTAYPDPRLWNNRVAALTAGSGSTVQQAVAVASAVSEASIYGRQVEAAIARFLVHALAQTQNGVSLEDVIRADLAENKVLKGYGRPVATRDVDERIPFMLARMEKDGVPMGPHLKLGFEIEVVLEKIVKRPLPMTYSTLYSAVPLDMGFTEAQCQHFWLLAFVPGFIPCIIEAQERPEGATFPVRCANLHYDGPGRRTWSE